MIRHAAIAVIVVLVLSGGVAVISSDQRDSSATASGHDQHRCRFHGHHGQLNAGPWGTIHWNRIALTPPADAVPELTPGSRRIEWRFANTDRHELADFLAGLPMSERIFDTLLQRTVADDAINGFTIVPDAALLRDLPPPARAALYGRLSQWAGNLPQVNAFRFWGASRSAWFDAAGLPDSLRAVISPYVYRHGHFMMFSELRLALNEVTGEAAKRLVVQDLASERTLTLRLKVSAGQNVDRLVAYWGAGDRDKAVRPLLQSLADAPDGGAVDVVHLLPPFARKRLYTYPNDRGPFEASVSRDCHWTALNFFRSEPDDRYASAHTVEEVLHKRFTRVAEPRFGDHVAFTSGGEIFHSAIYIADGVLFTRNGARRTRPWMLLPLCVMKDFYPRREAIELVYLRPKPNHTADRLTSISPGARNP